MERQESVDNTCPVCHEVIRVYSVGVCDHPICLRCSIKMRALCGQQYCAICRTNLPKVYLLREKKLFKDFGNRRYLENKKLSVCFQDESVRQEMETVLEHKCRLCRDRPPENTFLALRDHMRKQHTLFFCDLCVEHVKIFTHERKVYTRQQLAVHCYAGDKDNTSYKGHPLCRFCDERYMDNEELWRHLRKDHYYCHFCDADGSNDYYSDYDALMEHFRQCHYLCEEDSCIGEQFIHAFRTKIDLKAHHALCHNKSMSKAQARQARTLDLDFQLAPRSRNSRGLYSRGRGRELVTRDDSGIDNLCKRQSQASGTGPKPSRFNKFRDEDMHLAIQASLQTMQIEDMKKVEHREDSSSEEELVHNEDNFPALGAVGNNGIAASVTIQQSGKQSPSQHPDASFAHRIAKAQGKSVQHSQMSSEMLTRLPDPDGPCFERKNAKNNKMTHVKRQDPPPDGGYSNIIKHGNVIADGDFPELQSKKNSAAKTKSTVTQWTKQTHIENPITKYPKNSRTDHSVSHKIVHLSKKSKIEESKPSLIRLGKVLKDDNEFPSLGRNSYSSEHPIQNAHWVQQNKMNNPNMNCMSEPVVKNIQVMSERLDNDKKFIDKKNSKKKKEKSSSKFTKLEKSEKTLDNIANLLLDTDIGTVENLEQEISANWETVAVKHSKNKAKNSIITEGVDNHSWEMYDKMSCHTEMQQDRSIDTDVKKTEIVIVEATDNQSGNGVPGVFGSTKQMRKKGSDFNADDFPALTASSKAPSYSQPGFNSTVKPPPGFCSKTSQRPPPGFSSQRTKDTQTSTGKTRQGQNVDEFISTQMEYTKPHDFQNRNQKLIKDISTSLSGSVGQFDHFKSLSGEFRCGGTLAVDYYEKCERLLGQETFGTIFPELTALLPDIQKQKQLLAVFVMKTKKPDDNVLKISRGSRNDAWRKSNWNMQSCPTCQQVLVSADYGDHVAGHCQDPDFPVLDAAGSRGARCNGWIKAT